MSAPDKKLVNTPIEQLVGNPDNRRGSTEGSYDGLPGLPQRTSSPNAQPERTMDRVSGVQKGQG